MSTKLEVLGFSVLQEAIQQARCNALKAANAELVNLYWQVGAFVSKQLAQSQWGDKTVQQFADFLKKGEPGVKGFERKSIYRMIQFYETYRSSAIVAPVVRQLNKTENQSLEPIASLRRQFSETDIRHTLLAKLSWTNHLLVFSRCKTEEEREFYLRMSMQEKYSKRELDRQISAGLFERMMTGRLHASSLLKEKYPSASNAFKDSYVFEFLALSDAYSEGDLQKALIRQMKAFILELGKDFLFVDEEFKVQVGNPDFHLDLLFYHRGLQCLVAFELKKERFEPEHLGKLNFYLEALDRDIKKEAENPSIGILLCKDKDTEVVEYALSRSLSPTMVAEYKMQLPDKKLLQQKLHELFQNSTDANRDS